MDPIKPLRDKLSKPLYEAIEKLEPLVSREKGKEGKYSYLHSTFDGFKTFLFTPSRTTHSGVHIRDGIDLKRTMFLVVIALIPCLLHGIFNVGHMHYVSYGEYLGLFDGFWLKTWYGLKKVIPIVVVSYGVGLGVEFIFAEFRKHPVNEGFLVSGMLIPLIMPPDIPLWMVAVATIFAVIIGKEAFGGTGMNILNVALLARVFIFFAYPTYISGDQVWISNMADGYSGASIMGVLSKEAMEGANVAGNFFSSSSQTAGFYSPVDMILGFIPGSIGETSLIAIGIGAVILLVTGIGSWQIMLSFIVGVFVMGGILNFSHEVFDLSNPFLAVTPQYHLIIGGLMFAAVFMATDPVTAAQTDLGKYIYGFLIGVVGLIIRVTNPAYPEGWMLAILFMNVFAPLIDHIIIESNIKRRLARG